jgi:hypothetical protein
LISELKNEIKTKIKKEYSDLYLSHQIIVNFDDLTLKECMGWGNFGCVYKGIFNLADNIFEKVAVKRLENCEFIWLNPLIKINNSYEIIQVTKFIYLIIFFK